MLNDVIFNGNKSAYNDWGIILTSSDIGLPTPKLAMVDIKGADGVLDLSTVLTNDIKFNNRSIKLTFELMNIKNYQNVIDEICDYIHGNVITFSFSNDPYYYYTGRATINSWQCSKNKGSIVINIDAEPYKMDVSNTVYPITVNNETVNIELVNKRKVVCPVLTVTGNVSLTVNDATIELDEGTYQLTNLLLHEGFTPLTVSGTGSVIFEYQMGVI